MKKTILTGISLAALAVVGVGTLAAHAAVGDTVTTPNPCSAPTCTSSNQTVQVTAQDTLTLSTNGNSSLTITPGGDGFGTVNASDLTVNTNHGTGYTLILSMIAGSTGDTQRLLPQAPATATDYVAPVASGSTLSNGQWGYALATTTTSSTTFNPVPVSASPVVIKTSAGPVSNDTTQISFGANATGLTGGVTYANQVTYTAYTNATP